MVLTKCCWFIDLEIGAFIIAWFDFFYSIVSFSQNVYYLNSDEHEFIQGSNSTEQVLEALTRNPAQQIRSTHVGLNVFMIIVSVGLLYGLIQKSYRFIVGWLIVNGVVIIFLGLAIFYSICLLFQYGASVMLGVTLYLIFECGLKFYIYFVIYSQFKLIYNESFGVSTVIYKTEQPLQTLQTNAVIEYGSVNPPMYDGSQYN